MVVAIIIHRRGEKGYTVRHCEDPERSRRGRSNPVVPVTTGLLHPPARRGVRNDCRLAGLVMTWLIPVLAQVLPFWIRTFY